ncbi:MAG: hypothetical protein D6803_05770 [Anaerolineae bacterium]|nr:MAG: hypothetical protein D6803_05770 [Anaerolineae bacterium]
MLAEKRSLLSQRQLRAVGILRFALPLVLYLIVVWYEVNEHWIRVGQVRFDINLSAEIFFFGVLGPTAVFIVLSYIIRLLRQQIEFAAELEVLNVDLERKVAERTAELEERNAELARAYAELQELDQLKSDFVSLVSHELRGPLTTLNGGLELALSRGNDLHAETRAILETMAAESERLTRFVSEILDLSRLEAGKLQLNLGPVAVRPLLKRAVEVTCECKGRVVEWDVPEVLPPVWGDEIYLEKVVENLLSNAVKYSPADQPIRLSARLKDDRLAIAVEDYGPGIPPHVQQDIFERFHRLERGDRIAQSGWGLGLYFAKALTEAHGGEIRVQSPAHPSSEHPGTIFTLELPITAEVPEDA